MYPNLKAFYVLAFGMALATPVCAQTNDEPLLLLNPGTEDEIPLQLDNAEPARINPNTGNIEIFTLDPQACNAGGGSCPSAQVLVAPFAPDPARVQQGSFFTATLSSLGAVKCRRTGLSGTTWNTNFITPPDNGTRTQNIPADFQPGEYQLRYECENGDFSDSSGPVTLEVIPSDDDGTPPPTVPESCEDVPLPDSWRRDTTAFAQSSASTRAWGDFFTLNFPATQGANLAINKDRYAAFSFDPSAAPSDETWTLGFGDLIGSVPPTIGTVAPTISISECPGDFRPELGNCRLMLGEPFRFTKNPNDTANRCVLPEADTLYLNITYIAQFELNKPGMFIWNCGGKEECGHFVQ